VWQPQARCLTDTELSAGGLGSIGGLGYTPDQLRKQIQELKADLKDPKLPFGVDCKALRHESALTDSHPQCCCPKLDKERERQTTTTLEDHWPR
jgi:NAD(P)H-dependent flavin oxidoreductase YrpB (nitropropane dioxygenase family)